MVTRTPRDFSRLPRLEAVSPLPREDATPPVTKMCLVGPEDEKGEAAKSAPVVDPDGGWFCGGRHNDRPRGSSLPTSGAVRGTAEASCSGVQSLSRGPGQHRLGRRP